MKSKPYVIVLLVLNVIVLLGQIWPEGAPPFARTVNILFLVGSLIFFVQTLRRKGSAEEAWGYSGANEASQTSEGSNSRQMG
ncbi:MAG: hypothetical protein ACI97A_003160 [Planctomycetota bacterium]|jgi:hypothetical protein